VYTQARSASEGKRNPSLALRAFLRRARYNEGMLKQPPAPPLPAQQEYLLPGCNALETSLTLAQSWTRKGKPFMLIDTVKRVLEVLEQNQIPYAIIGGLAVSHHAVPRFTQDVDLVIRAEDMGRIRSLFPGCYQRGTSVVEVYDIGGTRVDVLPAKLRYQREVVARAVPGDIQGTPARVASVRDLILLKMFAAPDRHEVGARMQDETDIVRTLEMNREKVAKEEIRYIGDRLLELCFTADERAKTVQQLEWLNDTLAQLGMADRAYPLSK
jgi:hypothetical protein